MLALALVAAALLPPSGCRSTGPSGPGRVAVGTWGGRDAGMVVEERSAHVHIGCTRGDVGQGIPLDADGHFDVTGTYNVDAFPIDRGILHPARFAGDTDGRSLTLSVRLTDTGQTLGPVVLRLGVTPQMANCPICAR